MQLSAREAVLKQLNNSEVNGFQTGYCVEKINSEFGLDARDASLAVNIYLGCIQFRYKLDYYINACSDISPDRIDLCVRNILRMGVYQVLFLDRIPVHAAVDEAVRLCKKYRPRAASFVNAVLRHITADSECIKPVSGDPVFRLSVEYSAQQWFVEYLIDCFGEEFTEAFLYSSNQPAPLSLKVNSLKISKEEYKELLDESSVKYRDSVFDGILYVESCDVKRLPGYEEGFFFVQDPAAASCAAAAGIRPGDTVLDACASPGGKSFSAAMAMENRGSILACDISSKKIRMLADGAGRLGMDIIRCSVCDAKEYDQNLDSRFDAVIADVPCSGFGVLRKKPEIKYKSREDIRTLPAIQNSMLDNLSRYVKPGGVLLYSTCTVLREENEAVVNRFLAEHDGYMAVDFSCCNVSSVNGMYTFFPNVNGTDGFFISKLCRVC